MNYKSKTFRLISAFLLIFIAFIFSLNSNTAFAAEPTLIWTQTSNPGMGHDRAYAIAADSTAIYVAGSDSILGDYQWRIEKRSLSTGDLIWAKTNNPSIWSETIYAITIDSTGIYVAGWSYVTTSDYRWRVEKRSLINGDLIWAQMDYPNMSMAYAIAVDSTGIYVAGFDYRREWIGSNLVGAQRWRIEKRSLSTGSLIWTQAMSYLGEARAIAIDSTGIYVAGADFDYALGTNYYRWRIEKRSLTNGTLLWTKTSDPSAWSDVAYAITVDSTGIYIAGSETVQFASGWGWFYIDTQQRIEKRNLSTGDLIWVQTSDLSTSGFSFDEIYAITIDSTAIYVAGSDSIPGDTQWRIEKRNLSTGNLIWIQTSNLGTFWDIASAIVIDSTGIYAAGWDDALGSTDYRWRIEKYSQNNPPFANAGLDKSVNEGSSVAFSDATASDPDGDPLTYSWSCTGGSLSSSTVLQPTYTAPMVAADTNYACTLTVTDSKGANASDSAVITVKNNNPPFANAGLDKSVNEGSSVAFSDATASDPDGDPMTYSWSCAGGSLSSSTILQPTYTAPMVAADTNYACTLTVTDSKGANASDSLVVSVKNLVLSLIFAATPTKINKGQSSTLSWSSANTTSCTASGAWSGTKATSGSEAVSPIINSTYTLTCSGPGGDTISKSVTVIINNPPIVNAGLDKSVNEGSSVAFSDATASDPDGDPMTYSWSCAGGSLSSSTILQPTYTAPMVAADTNYACTLTAKDSFNLSASDSAVITVKNIFGSQPATTNVFGYAWSENAGWISFNCQNNNSCAANNYGVYLDPTSGNFSGYVWSENIGWIDFNPAGPYPSLPNYSAKLDLITNKASGWARAVAFDASWDGWIKLAGANYEVVRVGCNLTEWAWGSDVLGWIHFNYPADSSLYRVYTSLCANEAPSAINLSVAQPNYCVFGPAASFSWTFSDPDVGQIQSAYQVQVDNNSDFSSPEKDSGKIISASNSYSTTVISYAQTYYWRVKVWDNGSPVAESAWINGPSFATPLHVYPTVDFNWSPTAPLANADVQFTDASIVFGGASKSIWAWTFQNGIPLTSSAQNPKIKFSVQGNNQVTLNLTDSDGFVCNKTKTVGVKKPAPKWKEAAP